MEEIIIIKTIEKRLENMLSYIEKIEVQRDLLKAEVKKLKDGTGSKELIEGLDKQVERLDKELKEIKIIRDSNI